MRNLRLRLLPWLVLLLGLTATWLAWRDMAALAEAERVAHFESLFRQATGAIAARIDSYRDANLGGAGLFRASEEVTREAWRQYAESLDLLQRQSGARGIGVVERRADAGGEHFVVRFIEPEAPSRGDLGRDLGADPELRLAMEQARDRGDTVLSSRVLVGEGSERRPGFVLFTPVYADDASGGTPRSPEQRRAQIVGWIYAPFVASEFVAGLFADVLRELRGEIAIGIYAGSLPTPSELLHEDPHPAERRDFASGPPLLVSVALPLYGRTWSILARRGPGYDFEGSAPEARRLALTGSLVTLSLFGLLQVMQRTRRRAGAPTRGRPRS